MATILLILIYVFYVGLGVPDSSFGSALPAMWEELNLPVSLGSVITVIIAVCTLISSFCSARLISKFKEGIIVAVSTLLTAVALFGFAISNAFWIVAVSAIPLGLGAGSIDVALNNYVASRYSALKVNILHCSYGVGVALTPFVFSFALKDNNWRLGFFIVCGVQIFLSILAFCTLSLWKKVDQKTNAEEEFKPVLLGFKTMIKTPSIRALWLTFFFTCALEFTCDTWATTFLKEGGLTESLSATFLTIYFVGMALGRVSAGFLSIKLSLFRLLSICYLIIFVAIIMLFLPLPTEVKGASLFFIGLGNGPTFPNLTVACAKRYDRRFSQSLVASCTGVASFGIMTLPALFGIIINAFSRKTTTIIFPIYCMVLFMLMVLFTFLFYRRPKEIKLDK